MSTAAKQAPARVSANTRRVPRFPLAVPADVTILRSGIPYSIPGRSVTLGEGGVGLVLAGELHPGDSVGIEFRLPGTGAPFRLKAVVRYQALFHCGLEFVSLTSEQQTLIEHWTRRKSGGSTAATIAGLPPAASQPSIQSSALPRQVVGRKFADRKRVRPVLRRVAWAALIVMLLLTIAGWWQWRQAWGELESQIPSSQNSLQHPPLVVPAEAMERLLVHKIDPIYPDAARQAKVQGVVILETVIGRDGAVIDVHPISGPEELAPAAVDAVKWWRFQPYQANGQAVEVETKLAVEFREN